MSQSELRNDPIVPQGLEAFDHLATLVCVVVPDGRCLFANSAFEETLGLSRRAMLRESIFDWVVAPGLLKEVVSAVARNEYATSRLEAELRRHLQGHGEPLQVQVIVTRLEQGNLVLIELVEVEQQTRLDRDERALDQAQANKELIRNLAHEIKNPLGGIRGSAQLLQMELESKSLTEYTQVIIHEADRLQSLVDRLLAPHRRPHVVGDVNIHEVCERVRSLILAEFPKGLRVQRDYDISLPDFPQSGMATANDLRVDIGAPANGGIQKLIRSNNTLQVYTGKGAGLNFNLTPGASYRVKLTGTTNVSFVPNHY